ncbi:27837_t:CDS:2, partial [Gigaspora margarita]
FKKDISFFVDLIGVSTKAIDALSHAGIMISGRHLDREKTAIADNYPHQVASYIETIPPVIPNGISIHNPRLIDSELICTFLDNYYMEQMAKTLKEIDQYIDALQHVYKIPSLTNYLTDCIIPVVANWPRQKKSTYADKDHLALLTKKAEKFLLETFGKIYQRLGQSSIVKVRNEKVTYKLVLLNITIDKKQMLLGFSSVHLPTYDKYDHYHLLLCDGTGKSSMVIACSYGYHKSCFSISLNGKYHYCEDILKLGIRNNISSLLSRLSKLDNNKLNLKEIIEADKDSSQNQKISNENDILEVFRKDKQAFTKGGASLFCSA